MKIDIGSARGATRLMSRMSLVLIAGAFSTVACGDDDGPASHQPEGGLGGTSPATGGSASGGSAGSRNTGGVTSTGGSFDSGGTVNTGGSGPTPPDAGTPGSSVGDGGRIADAATEVCSADGPLVIAGDYVAADGTEYWLRRTATATTYTVVPKFAPAQPSPQLYRVTSVCPQWLSIRSTDGTLARLDWESAGSSLRLCVRAANDAAALEALSAPGAADERTCLGSAWLSLSKVTP